MKNRFSSFILCFVLLSVNSHLHSQTDTISGIINQYAHVSALNPGSSSITVSNTAPFTPEQKVLLIQMRGADINEDNNSNFGIINSLSGAGSYVVGTVCTVDGGTNEIVLQESIDPTFANTNFDSAGIQLVTIPTYSGDVLVDGPLTAQAWDGQTGGILAMDVTGDITLEDDVSVDGLGFKGGEKLAPFVDPCNFLTNLSANYYAIGSSNGGGKGAGIAAYTSGREAGRGPLATGGGGGNGHNTGGAGGGNYGLGGSGGNRRTTTFTCQGNNPGREGKGLSGFGYSLASPFIFMGGGGGAGHGNNGESPNGGTGGGIILMFANDIIANGHSISANGDGVADAFSDGGSGGGAGGAILLEINSVTGSLSVSAQGGRGGNTLDNFNQCQGPGGGGAGGVIWSSITLSVPVSTNVLGGAAGQSTDASCFGAQGAGNGAPGMVLNNYAQPTPSMISCVLPASWIDLQAKIRSTGIDILGEVEDVDKAYLIETRRKQPDSDWESLGLVSLSAENASSRYPGWTDSHPPMGPLQYQMVLIDGNGQEIPSPIVEVLWQVEEGFRWWPIKQLGSSSSELNIWMENPTDGLVAMQLLSLDGKQLWSEEVHVKAGKKEMNFDIPSLAQGIYLLAVRKEGKLTYRYLVK